MQALKIFLENEIIGNRIRIQKLIFDFEKENVSYRNIELNENLQLILRKGGYEKLILIGFPLPLESYPLSGFKSKKDTLIFVCIDRNFYLIDLDTAHRGYLEIQFIRLLKELFGFGTKEFFNQLKENKNNFELNQLLWGEIFYLYLLHIL